MFLTVSQLVTHDFFFYFGCLIHLLLVFRWCNLCLNDDFYIFSGVISHVFRFP